MCSVCIASNIQKNDGKSRHGFSIRAEGPTEFEPAKYQLKRVNEKWPKGWSHTMDLAGSVGILGFENKVQSRKTHALCEAIVISLKGGDVYATYPHLQFTHKALIWGEPRLSLASRIRKKIVDFVEGLMPIFDY